MHTFSRNLKELPRELKDLPLAVVINFDLLYLLLLVPRESNETQSCAQPRKARDFLQRRTGMILTRQHRSQKEQHY